MCTERVCCLHLAFADGDKRDAQNSRDRSSYSIFESKRDDLFLSFLLQLRCCHYAVLQYNLARTLLLIDSYHLNDDNVIAYARASIDSRLSILIDL